MFEANPHDRQGGYNGPVRKPTRAVDIYAAALNFREPIRPATVRVWVHRGELKSYGHDRRGRLLVSLDELTTLMQRKASEKASASA
jgi:hypothetical protein